MMAKSVVCSLFYSKKRVKTSPAQRVDLRRSIRLINHGPIGFLGGLPMEMLYNLFDYLSCEYPHCS